VDVAADDEVGGAGDGAFQDPVVSRILRYDERRIGAKTTSAPSAIVRRNLAISTSEKLNFG